MAKRKKLQLSRGWKTVRNFAALALVLAGCWALYQTPFWMMEYDMGKDIAGDIQILWRGGLDGREWSAGGGAPPTDGTPMVVARTEKELHTRYLGSYEGHYWLRGNPGISVTGEPEVFSSTEISGIIGRGKVDLFLLAVNLPEAAVRGEVQVMTATGEAYAVSGRRDMDVIWFPLSLDSDDAYPGQQLINAAYTLTLYDKDDMFLNRAHGLLHEEGAS